MTSICTKRVLLDIKNLKNNPIDGIHLWVNPDDITKMIAMIVGVKDTPYEDGLFFFSIKIPEQYPFVPPKVLLLNPEPRMRFHPNMYENGKVCLSILGTWNGPGWTSVQTLSSVLVVLQSLFQNDPLRCEPGHENEKQELVERYTSIVEHEVLRCCLCFEYISKRFEPYFEEAMSNHLDACKNRVEGRLVELQKRSSADIVAPAPFRRVKIKTQYDKIMQLWQGKVTKATPLKN